MKSIFRYACLLSAIALPSPAQEPNPFGGVPGKYTFRLEADSFAAYRLDPASRDAALSTLRQIDDLLHAAPVMNPPRGFDASSLGRALTGTDVCPRENCSASPVASQVWLLLSYFVADESGRPVTGPELNVSLNVYANSPGASVSHRHQLDFEGASDINGRTMYFEPKQTRTIGGFPMFDDDVVVIARNHRPLWLPVSRDNFLRAALRDTRKAIADTGMPSSDLAQGLRARLDALQAESNALSPSELASQAWLGDSASAGTTEAAINSGLAPAGAPDARPLVIVNPEFLDRSLPRSAVQILAVRLNWGTYLDQQTRAIDTVSAGDHVSVLRLRQLIGQLDWKKLASLVAAPR